MAGIEAVADAFGGRHVSAGEFRPAPDGGLDLDAPRHGWPRWPTGWPSAGCWWPWRPFPWSALPDVGTAVELLRRAGSANAGLMIDVWHFFNGGAEPELLADLPGPAIAAAVQLNDGPRVHDGLPPARACRRRLPGDGELDVVGLVRAVAGHRFRRAVVRRGEHPGVPTRCRSGGGRKAAADAARAVLDAARR